MNPQQPSLRIDGEVETPREYQPADLEATPEADRVDDVSRYQPTRRGVAVRLDALLREVRPRSEARYLTLHASQDDFYVTLPLESVRGEAVVVYQVEGRSLTLEDGGPFRFLILNPAACRASDLDDCANIKHLDRIELRSQPGPDTRPHDEAQHAALHARQNAGLSGS